MIATAAFSGAALAVCGLLLQTLFANPLASPSILGISTGSSLGVAIVMLLLGGSTGALAGTSIGGYAATLAGALVGALAVMAMLLAFSAIVRSATMLLIVGILVSYLTSSAISLLNFSASQEGVHSYVVWGLGTFSGVTLSQLPLFIGLLTIGIAAAWLMTKPLNALLLGIRLLLVTGILTAVVTAFCGPIGFIGLVVPHIARLMLRTSDHARLIPATILGGAVIALFCTLLSVLPPSGILPINALTPIIGVPVIIYVILNRRRIFYFN